MERDLVQSVEAFAQLLHPLVGLLLYKCLTGSVETARSTDPHPGHCDPDFREACRRVLLASIERQQPKLILVLGLHAGRILGEVMGLAAWSNAKTGYRSFDALRLSDAGLHLNCPGTGAPLAAVIIIHPSVRSNLRYRSFDNLVGNEAEIAMVRRAMQACRILT